VSGFLATHRVDVLRGTGTDDYGDATDVATVVAVDVNVSIVEGRRGQRWADASDLIGIPASGRETAVRRFTGRARPGVDIRAGDRLRDQGSASIYLVEATFATGTPTGQADTRLELRRIDD
jgi:hypothetical protein